VLYDVIVLSQPCYGLFEKMAYMQGYRTVLILQYYVLENMNVLISKKYPYL